MARLKKSREETNADRLARYDRIVQAYELAGLPTTQISIGNSLKPKIGQGAVSAWKRVNPSLAHLCQIVRKTGVCGHWLLLGEGSMWPNSDSGLQNAMQQLIDQLPADAQKAIRDRIDGK